MVCISTELISCIKFLSMVFITELISCNQLFISMAFISMELVLCNVQGKFISMAFISNGAYLMQSLRKYGIHQQQAYLVQSVRKYGIHLHRDYLAQSVCNHHNGWTGLGRYITGQFVELI